MKELLDYERVLWALARALYETNEATNTRTWALASPAVKANFRTKADHCLNGWGYENVKGTLSTRTYPADVYHRATHDAQDLYLKSLIEKYEEEPPTMQRASHRKTNFDDAIEALAKYAYECSISTVSPSWNVVPDHDKTAYRSIANTLLSARGFVPIEGSLQLTEGNGPIFTTVAHVLRDGFALNRVEALVHNDAAVFNKYVELKFRDVVHEAIRKASDRTNGRFSTYDFNEALYELAGYDGPAMNSYVVRAILGGREDVEFEPPCHYRVRDVRATQPLNMLLDEFTPEEKVDVATKMWNGGRLSDNGAGKLKDAAKPQQERLDTHTKTKPVPEAVSRTDLSTDPGEASDSRHVSDGNPFLGSNERRRAEMASASPYPVNEDGAEDYRAVQADASVIQDATRVLGRDLYEKAVADCVNPTSWRDLLPAHQNYYYEQAKTLPLNLVELREVFNKQQEADAKTGKEVKPAPSFVPIASILREPTPMSGVQGVGGMIAATRSIGSRQDMKSDTKCETKAEAADNYGLLAESAYALLCVHIPYDPWKNLKWFAKRTLKGIAEDAWLMRNPVLDARPDVNFFWNIVNELREIALSQGMTLNQFLATDEMRTVREGTKFTLPGTANNYETLPVHIPTPTGGLILPETTALAWYAHETSRMDNNALLPWCKLSARAQYVKMRAARDYFVHNKRDPSQSEPFYAALDAVPRNAVSYLCIAYHELRHLNTNPYVLRFLFDK